MDLISPNIVFICHFLQMALKMTQFLFLALNYKTITLDCPRQVNKVVLFMISNTLVFKSHFSWPSKQLS